ncbi:MAG: ATP synthase F1 subunit epsilon [Clostridiales Family XIII bacterium]|jgi:F-type H+-transporting ATPase subunit epsilon|nr:ATP synthase F1 subunit epsilon [Clostridiales Family XIII bacterium]
MAEKIRLQIVTPERLFYDDSIELVIVRTLSGDEGFMARHAWATKLLDVGEIWIQEAGQKDFKVAAAGAGFIDVKNEITIFVDAAEWPEEIDVARSQEQKEAAEQYLKTHTEKNEDNEEFLYYRASLQKAMTRMLVAKGGSRKSKK